MIYNHIPIKNKICHEKKPGLFTAGVFPSTLSGYSL